MVYIRLLLVFSYILLFFVLTAVASIFVSYPNPLLLRLKYWNYKGVYKLLGGRIHIKGSACDQGPVLFVSNHVSYTDILVFGAFLNASFVSKSEVSKWPIIGRMAKLHGTVFVNRRRNSVKGQLGEIQQHLRKKQNLIIFPEGTSADGTHVQPLKSSFLDLPKEERVVIQPVTISYTHQHGIPLGRFGRWAYGWFGDTDLLPHLKFLLTHGPFTSTVCFHQPFYVTDLDRKDLTRQCAQVLNDGMLSTIDAQREDCKFMPSNDNIILLQNALKK